MTTTGLAPSMADNGGFIQIHPLLLGAIQQGGAAAAAPISESAWPHRMSPYREVLGQASFLIFADRYYRHLASSLRLRSEEHRYIHTGTIAIYLSRPD